MEAYATAQLRELNQAKLFRSACTAVRPFFAVSLLLEHLLTLLSTSFTGKSDTRISYNGVEVETISSRKGSRIPWHVFLRICYRTHLTILTSSLSPFSLNSVG